MQQCRHEWAIDDARAFFIDRPSWAPPMGPMFADLADDDLPRAAETFESLVRDAQGDSDGVPTGALLGMGSR